ncbi:MAG: YihA family ribosome biogenesis GTP-binding protein [Alphaproteobacteria bacterium]|nr:YihA family ribosome biogenesis GTP-binding protein [Alphaproteobacteria bacterium]
MAFKIEPYSNEQIAAGERLFKAQTSFMLGVANLNQLPLTTLNEVAFAGRSNVGKSSLINAVTGQKGLAKTSNTPGRTQQLNYFNADDKIILVDLPGYGYAQAPENMVKQWQKMIFAYLQGRVNLKRVFVLIDSRHGIKKVDEEIMNLLDKAAVTYQIILTKTDKTPSSALAKVLAATELKIEKKAAAYIRVLTTSSEKNIGIEEVRAEIASLI